MAPGLTWTEIALEALGLSWRIPTKITAGTNNNVKTTTGIIFFDCRHQGKKTEVESKSSTNFSLSQHFFGVNSGLI